MQIAVNELFETLQGEATFTGTPAVFLRLQGCAVGCSWCDTKHTWDIDAANERPFDEVAAKTEVAAPTFSWCSEADIVRKVRAFRARHVVVTGGEPCNFDLTDLTAVLLVSGYAVQVETSGTQPVRVHDRVWVTLSPKIDMPGGFKVRADAVARANEIKMPVGKPADVDKLLDFMSEFGVHREKVWVQPLSRSDKATKLCIEAATRYGWRVSIQTHALIGVR